MSEAQVLAFGIGLNVTAGVGAAAGMLDRDGEAAQRLVDGARVEASASAPAANLAQGEARP